MADGRHFENSYIAISQWTRTYLSQTDRASAAHTIRWGHL